jgi:hypothetical protein
MSDSPDNDRQLNDWQIEEITKGLAEADAAISPPMRKSLKHFRNG